MSDAMESLLQSVATAEKLKTKSNDELADIIEEHVWADFEMCSAQSVLLGEVMDRLRNLKTCASCHGWGYVEHARCVPCSGTGDVAPPADAATEAYAAFGRALLPLWWDDGNPGDIDGGMVQTFAEKFGLWHQVERHAEGVECDWCGNEGWCGELTEAGLSALSTPAPAPSAKEGV